MTTLERKRERKGLEFCRNAADTIANPRSDFNGGGLPFVYGVAPRLILGLRVCSVGFDCGFDNRRLLKKLDEATVPQLVPDGWEYEAAPVTHVSGRYVYIEVPWPLDLQRNDIRLDDISTPRQRNGSRIVIGPNARGVNITLPAREIEHLLSAGQTGGGKSWLMRSCAAQLSVPERDRPPHLIVLVDGKGGEGLGIVDGLPGQVGPLAFDPDTAINALGWCVDEMGDRYEQIRNSGGYRMDGDTPHIFVVFDEPQRWTKGNKNPAIVALMNTIATQGRAAGLHFLVGTQKPLVGVFGDSTTADQFSGAVGFRVKSYQASAAIFGGPKPRADTLLPAGDAYVVAASPRTVQERVQVAYIPEDELARISGGRPMLDEWPEYDIAGLDQKANGRPQRCTTPREIAVGIDAVLRKEASPREGGRPWYRKQFPKGKVPGAGRASRILGECREIVEIMRERGLSYAATQ